MSRVAENIFEKGVDFQRAKCEIATNKSSRQTVLSAESSTGKSLLSASDILRMPSLEIAQLFPSAYFKKTLSRSRTRYFGIFRSTIMGKYILLQNLCQVNN
jgi:hypothetical protein